MCAGAGGATKASSCFHENASVPPVDDFLRLGFCTLKNAKLEKESCENVGSYSPQRDRLKGEVAEVHRIMFPNSIHLQPHCLKCKRKLFSTCRRADLESVTLDGNTASQNVEGSRRL